MANMDIRTRVELKNETIRETVKPGVAGKVALIGAFPSSKRRVYAATNYSQIVNHYGVNLGTTDVYWYNGVRCARRIFMEGIRGQGGASSITCVNICKYKPTNFTAVEPDYREVYLDPEERTAFTTSDGIITPPDYDSGNLVPEPENKYVPQNCLQKEDVSLTFDKLQMALNQIADEDMDILFVANDLREIFNYPLGDEVTTNNITTSQQTSARLKTNPDCVKDDEEKHVIIINSQTCEPVYTGTDSNKKLKVPYTFTKTDKGWQGAKIELAENEEFAEVVFKKDGLVKSTSSSSTGDLLWTTSSNINKLVWQVTKIDKNGETIYGETNTGKYIRNLGDVYDYILDFVDNEFTNHRPVTYMGAIYSQGTPEGVNNSDISNGVMSNYIRLQDTKKYTDMNALKTALGTDAPSSNDEESIKEAAEKHFNSDGTNPYWNIQEFGALTLAKLFTRTTNELSTCGLFYQGGIIAKEEVDATELAAHICGWLCGMNIAQDLTYQTIPGLTSIDEEPYLGAKDAGTLLNQAGIQVIRPKSRLDKTFYVNNSVQPSGWHTNHIRSVVYLLKRMQFETGLGMNNLVTNKEMLKAILESVVKEVRSECEVITNVEIGDIETIDSYHIFIPVSITLSGIITVINVGVSMTLDETGTTTTKIKTTNGYSITV